MAIKGLDQEQFRRILRENLTPAKAITSPEHLKGRANALQQIDRAFNSPGKHVFVYGDRGVGKTSLAQTAAILHQSTDGDPIVVAWDQDADFYRLVRDMLKRCLPSKDLVQRRKTGGGIKLNLGAISADISSAVENGHLPDIVSINDAINVARYIAQFHSEEPVVIVDEFDQVKSDKEKKNFADFIKQLSDQNVGIRLILCGIGSSLDELIGTHLSTGRYLSPIELDRLSHDARWEIIRTAARALNVDVDQEFQIRIGQISDGFPYYVHLIGETIFWAMLDDPLPLTQCKARNFEVGVKNAVAEAQTSLKAAYEKATQKYSDDYQEVLWAVADGTMLRRQISEIYDKSYVPIMALRPTRKVLDKEKFYSRMNLLKTDRHGNILVATSAGWYQFRENIVRGYVRLRAEAQNIPLGKDHFASGAIVV